jgi:hypothetical protein
MSNKNYSNKGDLIEKMIKEGIGLDKMLEKLGVDKQEITQFQANFTPIKEVDLIIKNSGISSDTRQKLLILEPTAGIGGVVGQLLLEKNKENYFIDVNEYHSAFYQIGKGLYKDIDNVKWFNSDFWVYSQKYNYDYIFGNPPFNLKHQVLTEIKFEKEKGKPPPDPPSPPVVLALS